VKERVDKSDPGLRDLPNIAGCEGDVVLQCRRDELAVLDRYHRMKRHDLSPSVGALLAEWKNARAVAQHERREPRVEAGGIRGARHALSFDALPDLSEGDDAQVQAGTLLTVLGYMLIPSLFSGWSFCSSPFRRSSPFQ
jgi:hypothetical protein